MVPAYSSKRFSEQVYPISFRTRFEETEVNNSFGNTRI